VEAVLDYLVVELRHQQEEDYLEQLQQQPQQQVVFLGEDSHQQYLEQQEVLSVGKSLQQPEVDFLVVLQQVLLAVYQFRNLQWPHQLLVSQDQMLQVQ